MKVSNVIEKSCYFFNEITSYEIVKDFSPPLLAALTIAISIYIASRSLSKQYDNIISAQQEEAKRKIKIELFKDISLLIEHGSTVIRTVNSHYIMQNCKPKEGCYSTAWSI